MQEFIATFHIDWKLMLAQAINFGLVFAVFYLLAAKPLGKLIKDRTQEIQTGLSNAKAGRELFQKAEEEHEKNTIKLRQMSIEAQKELQKDLEKLKAEHTEIIKKDNEEWTKKRKEQLEIDKKTLVEKAKGEVMTLAVLAAEKLLNEKGGSGNDKAVKELSSL